MLFEKNNSILNIKVLTPLLFLSLGALSQTQPALFNKNSSRPIVNKGNAAVVSAKNKTKQAKNQVVMPDIDAAQVVIVKRTAPTGVDVNQLPLFGEYDKSDFQKKVESQFVEDCKGNFSSTEEAKRFFLKMGWQYLEEGDKSTALTRFNYAYLLDQKEYESYWGLGVIEFQNGNIPNAVRLMEKGLTCDSSNYIMMVDLATLYLKQASAANPNPIYETSQAIKYINQAIEVQPQYANAYYQLALAYMLQGKYDLAWLKFHKAYELSPKEVNNDILVELLKHKSDPYGTFIKD